MHVDVLKFLRYHKFLQNLIQGCGSIEVCTCLAPKIVKIVFSDPRLLGYAVAV
jgi:hypothetical protein